MLKVAVTGNIASGKSEVQKILEEKGYKVLDTDVLGHDVLVTCSEIKSAFSDYDVFNSDGTISREKLGKLVFSDKMLKNKLESISHPIIREKITGFFKENCMEQFVFVAIPLLYEANMEDMFDKVILVYADDSVREDRLIARNNYSKEYANQRINSQMPQEKKFKMADFVITNNGDMSNLRNQVEDLLFVL